jgi:Uma2 family endonuclease
MRDEVRAMVIQDRLMTVEEFWAEYADKPFELVRGRVIEVSPAGNEASETGVNISTELKIFVKAHPIGRITGADGGYQLGPNTMRAPDVGFYGNEKLATLKDRKKYLPFAPDLAVEVVSPNDSASEVQDKVALYLQAGTRLVWVFYPDLRQVVHHPDRTARTLSAEETLDGEDVLPGLQLKIADLFPPIDDMK